MVRPSQWQATRASSTSRRSLSIGPDGVVGQNVAGLGVVADFALGRSEQAPRRVKVHAARGGGAGDTFQPSFGNEAADSLGAAGPFHD